MNSLLIVEDDKDIGEALRLFLTMKGYTVAVSTDLVPDHLPFTPDVILMDVYLSGKSGKDCCKKLKHNPLTSNIPVVMMSATPVEKEECLAAGAINFIEKPFTLVEVEEAIKSAMAAA